MKKAEVVIIGGGIIGASAAYHLSEHGEKDVLILERDAQQGLGSTGKATGGVRAQFETEINIRMSLYSIDFFCKFNDLIGVDCGYEPRGYLFFATSDAQLRYLNQNVERQKALGLKTVEIIDTPTISKIVPNMCVDDILGGSFCSTDGFIDPLGVLNGFTKKAAENGVEIQTEVEVIGIEINNQKVCAVNTNRGRINTNNIVLAAGAWAGKLAQTAGVDLPVAPLRRQIVWAKSANKLPANLPMTIDLGTGFHFRPARNSDTELLFAYPDPDQKPGFETDFGSEFIEKVYEKAGQRAPFLAETEVIREKCRAGLYEMSPDHHAIIGGCHIKGLYLCNGFSGHGVMHSPAAGRAIAEILLHGKASFMDVSSLSLDRFAKRELIHETAFI